VIEVGVIVSTRQWWHKLGTQTTKNGAGDGNRTHTGAASEPLNK
jgi:hypothetical protein